MAYLTTDGVLDLALGKQHDTSSALRVKALAWLNEALQHLYLERDWLCLYATATLTASNGTITKPADYGRFRYAQSTASGGEFYCDNRNRLTDLEAYLLADPNDAAPVPSGFSEDATSIYFVPGVTGDVVLGYVKTVPTYADNETTIFEEKFKNVLSRAIQAQVYEYENDPRAMASLQLDGVLLSQIKTEENRQKPITKRTKYLRGYQ